MNINMRDLRRNYSPANSRKIVAECNPFALPSVNLAEKRLLPKTSGIYFVLLKKEVFYIGKSVNLPIRWQTHNFDFLQSSGEALIAWLEIKELKLLFPVEQRLIARFQLQRAGVPRHTALGWRWEECPTGIVLPVNSCY